MGAIVRRVHYAFGIALGVLATASVTACSDSAGGSPDTGTPSPSGDAGASEGGSLQGGTQLRVPVDATRAYVKLDPPSVVTVADPKSSLDWDLAFEGREIFTNSGPSGSGQSGAFGPLDTVVFVSDTAPAVPFIAADKAAGAFLEWYAYDGTTHALYSRFHVYGVKEGERLFKVQIVTYYGERDGAPVSGIFKVRYAELLPDGTSAPTVELADVDATAGGANAPVDVPSECLDLTTGTRSMLTPAQAVASTAWSLCFRRSNITVNGELGGPRGTTAVDLNAAETAGETVGTVQQRTDAAEKARFDAANAQAFAGLTFRGDRVVSTFGEAWLQPGVSPVAPTSMVWLAKDASGAHKFLIGFPSFENATATSPGTVVMQIKPVRD